MIIKLIPHVTYRDNASAELKREGETLYINGEPYDLSGDWVKLELEEGDSELIRSGVKEGGEAVIAVTAYQPDTARHKRAKSNGILEAMEQPITLNDGDSVTFPDYLEGI